MGLDDYFWQIENWQLSPMGLDDYFGQIENWQLSPMGLDDFLGNRELETYLAPWGSINFWRIGKMSAYQKICRIIISVSLLLSPAPCIFDLGLLYIPRVASFCIISSYIYNIIAKHKSPLIPKASIPAKQARQDL